MENCCIVDIGSYPHNENVGTGLIATITGNHIVRLSYLGSIIPITVNVNQGEEIVIPNNRLNENYTYEFTVEGPDGELVESAYCNTFKFKTYVNLNQPCDHTCDDVY